MTITAEAQSELTRLEREENDLRRRIAAIEAAKVETLGELYGLLLESTREDIEHIAARIPSEIRDILTVAFGLETDATSDAIYDAVRAFVESHQPGEFVSLGGVTFRMGWPKSEHICGRSGIAAKGDHVCSLCGSTDVFLCGSSAAPFDGRCCNKCNDSRVIPRRAKIAALIGLMQQASLTPFKALEARDTILGELFVRKVFLDPAAVKTAQEAEIVAWDSGLKSAALRGEESFEGSPWDAKPCNQILLLGEMAVLLRNGEADAEAIVVLPDNPRKEVQIAHAKIRRGQILAHDEGDVWLDRNEPRGSFYTSKGAFWIGMAALQAFMELEVVQREAARLPRQAARAAMRAGKPLPKVLVVRLRRLYAERETGESEREWHHRWMVRGHWRRQWYGKARTHKMIYIASFIKGPDGAPFLPPRDVVKVVTR